MLLAIAEGPLDELRGDVRSWFAFLPDYKVEIMRPTAEQRQAFFSDLLAHASRPPTEFPDGVPRRKRVLEDLPKAPPEAEKAPSKAELEQLQQQDERTLEASSQDQPSVELTPPRGSQARHEHLADLAGRDPHLAVQWALPHR
ncbi:TAT-binding protein-like protein 7, AAA ATPase [Tilletia horrida]|nr:TAT-binding protein-like protein 7, AAA ATPase [Tilletia horrida]